MCKRWLERGDVPRPDGRPRDVAPSKFGLKYSELSDFFLPSWRWTFALYDRSAEFTSPPFLVPSGLWFMGKACENSGGLPRRSQMEPTRASPYINPLKDGSGISERKTNFHWSRLVGLSVKVVGHCFFCGMLDRGWILCWNTSRKDRVTLFRKKLYSRWKFVGALQRIFRQIYEIGLLRPKFYSHFRFTFQRGITISVCFATNHGTRCIYTYVYIINKLYIF